MENAIDVVYEFGPFRLDSARRLLVRDGRPLTLPPKTFDLLILLVGSRGRVFTKKELMSALWPDTFVEDANLSFQISALRKALGEEGAEWIETLPRYGYRFSSDVREIDPHPVSASESPAHHDEPAPQPLKPSRIATRRALIPSIAVALIAIAAVPLAVTHLRETRSSERSVTFQVYPPDHVSPPDSDSLAVSPNGERLAFVGVGPDGGRRLWLRDIGSLTADPLPGTDLVDAVFWSPDSRSLAFFAGGKMKRLDLHGGSPQTICETPVGRSSGTWSRDGVILFETSEHPELYRVPASGGEPTVATHLDPANRETRHSAPQFLPDGRHFIYLVQSERLENTGVYARSLESSNSKRLTSSDANGIYARLSGGASYLLFARGTNLVGQAFDMNKLELTGNPLVVAKRLLIPISGVLPRATVSASENGVLAYLSRIDSGSTELVWFDRSGKRMGTVGPSADYSNPALSPDEKKLAVSRMDPQTRTRDLWLFDFQSGGLSRFTFDPADETNPVWSPDGTRIAFNSVHHGVSDIYEKAIAGSSEPKALLHSRDTKFIHGWSPDGKFLLYRIGPLTYALPGGGGVSLGPFDLENPRISPNGRWVAYTSNQSGRSEVYVQSFPPAEGKWQISNSGGSEPEWRDDGKELFFSSGDGLYAMQVKTDSPVFEPGVEKLLFPVRFETTVRRTHYQQASNGRRFLVNVPIEAPSPITVSINWAQNLGR